MARNLFGDEVKTATNGQGSAQGVKVAKKTAKQQAQPKKVKEQPINNVNSDFEAAQQVASDSEESGGQRATANTKTKIGVKQWLPLKKTIACILAGVVAAGLAITGGVLANQYSNRADENATQAQTNAEEARENAESAYNGVEGLVSSAESNISNANATYNTASGLVSQIEGETEVQDETQATIIASLTTEVRENTAQSMSAILAEAQSALNNASAELTTMTSSQTELNAEYENGNWSRVNEINASIKTNSDNISTYTKTATEKANQVISEINRVLDEAGKALEEAQEKTQESAENLYAQLPDFKETVSDAVALIDSSIANIQNYINKTSDEGTNAQLEALKQSATASKTEATNEQITFNSLVSQVESAYENGNYNDVIDLMREVVASAKTIGAKATSASDNALSAADVYANYQEAVNDELSKVIINIPFTDADLSNYQGITKHLINATYGGGKVNSVEQCTYNKNNGEVTILVNCTGKTGNQYRNLITATIATGLTDLDASSLVSRIKQGGMKTQVFTDTLEIGTSGSLTQNNVTTSGNVEIQYIVNVKYNDNTDKTKVSAQAIVVVTDNEGNVSYKVYKTSEDHEDGRVTENDVKAEYEAKLLDLIEADNSISLSNEASAVNAN